MNLPLRLLLLCALASTSTLHAEPKDVPAGVDQLALDRTNRIFAFGKAWTDKLAVFENKSWKEFQVSPSDMPSQPRGLLGLRDGRMASVWKPGDGDWVIAIGEGGRILQSCRFAWKLDKWNPLRITEDSQGRIWLTAALPEVVRFDPIAGSCHVFDLAPFQKGTNRNTWNNVMLTEDLRGGLWLWTADQASGYVSLLPLVRINGDALEALGDIPGYTGRNLVQVLVRDRNSLWMATDSQGLFILNLETLRAEQVPEPRDRAFDSIEGMFPFGKDWLVLSGQGYRLSIWQIQDGKWAERASPDSFSFIRRSFAAPAYLDLESGAILDTEHGLLFVPHGRGMARVLDWKNGWTLSHPFQLLSLGGDRFAALSREGAKTRWALGDLQDYVSKRRQGEVQEIIPWRGWTVDGQDRIFTFLTHNASGISVWENGSWRTIPLPAGIDNERLSQIEVDGSQRVWVFSDDISPVGILSPDLKTWEVVGDYRSALIKYREALGGFARDLWWLRPILGRDGQIAFRTQDWKLVHWDGQKWKEWQLRDIVPFWKSDRVGTPFFSEDGFLCVNTERSGKTWELGHDKKWNPVTKVPGIPDIWTEKSDGKDDRKLPAGFRPPDIQNAWVATDNSGMTWVAGNGNLYRYYKGRSAPYFVGSLPQPFLRNPPIQTARADRFGNTWFQVGRDSIEHILLPAKEGRPPVLEVTADRWGLVRLGPLPAGDVEWRLGVGKWIPLKPGEHTLGFFPPGKHELTVQVLTERLDRIGPMSKMISLDFLPPDQVNHLIAVLRTGPDPLRELAVKGLVAQPSDSIPALTAAIAKADFWWLRAALQECERQSPVAGHSP